MAEMKKYRCGRGHIVGYIRWDGHGAARLIQLRQSIDIASEQIAEPDVSGILDSGDVTCSICGESLTWSPSLPALLRLLKSHKHLMDGLRNLMLEQAMENSTFLERG